MAVSLSKGNSVSLTKASNENPNTPQDGAGNPQPLTAVYLGLGWEPRTTTGTDFDLDASAVVKKASSPSELVFFNQLTGVGGNIEHTGDNLTGEGQGDDEQIKVNLAALPADVTEIEFPVNIYDAENRGGQNFGQVRNAFVRVVNQNGDVEIARYDLSEDAATAAAMVFGKLVRNGSDWDFVAVGTPIPDYSQYLKGAGVNV